MEIIWTKTKTVVSLCLLAAVLAGVAVKHFWFPSVDDRFFRLDYQQLQRAPAGLFILRPTQFAQSAGQGCVTAWSRLGPGDSLPRFVGRNATLGQIFAAAYQCQPSRLVMPADAPANRYDLLVTVKKNPAQQLQAKLKSKFGYTAGWQEHEAEVLVLRANAQKLVASSNTATRVQFKNGQLNFTHAPVSQLLGLLESVLGKPAEDRTGLDGYYDFSIPWLWRGAQPDAQMLKKSLADYGLYLDTDTDTLQMMVVTRVR